MEPQITLPIVPLCRKPQDAAGQTYRNDINREQILSEQDEKGGCHERRIKRFCYNTDTDL